MTRRKQPFKVVFHLLMKHGRNGGIHSISAYRIEHATHMISTISTSDPPITTSGPPITTSHYQICYIARIFPLESFKSMHVHRTNNKIVAHSQYLLSWLVLLQRFFWGNYSEFVPYVIKPQEQTTSAHILSTSR